MIKFLLIVYFHGTKNYQSIFLFLNSVSNIYYIILYYTILYYTILYCTIYINIYISILYTINIVGYIYIYIVYAPHPIISICEYLETGSEKLISSNSLCDLASFILKNNYFENEELKYHQKRGFAIGTKFAPPYSNLFMAGL